MNSSYATRNLIATEEELMGVRKANDKDIKVNKNVVVFGIKNKQW